MQNGLNLNSPLICHDCSMMSNMENTRIAFIGDDLFVVNRQRIVMLAGHLGYKVADSIKDFHFNKPLSGVMVEDSIGTRDRIRLILNRLITTRKSLVIVALELYSVSGKALKDEWYRTSSNIFSYLKRSIFIIRPLFDLLLMQILMKTHNTTLVLPSILRIKYLQQKIGMNYIFLCVRNKPLLSYIKQCEKSIQWEDLPIHAVIARGRYLFLAGNINNEAEFDSVCAYAHDQMLDVIVASGQISLLEKYENKYPGIIYNIGLVNNDLVKYLYSKSMAGICLYRNDTANQKYSASGKLFEIMAQGKPVIYSDNPGVNYETKNYSQSKVYNINMINQWGSIQYHSPQPLLEYSFENELLNSKALD